MENAGPLLIVGTAFPYIEFLPKPGQARGVQIELDPRRIGLRFPVEVGLVGDSRRVLRELMPRLSPRADKTFLKEAQAGMQDWREAMEKRSSHMDMPMKPQVIAHELGRRLRSDAIVSCDSGTITTWWARHIPAKKGQMHSVSGNLASMACGLPYALAAQIAYPERQCVAFVGDGGFSMLMAGFCYRREISLAHQGRDHQEQRPRSNQVGADGLPRQSGIWSGSQSHRFFRGRPCLWGNRFHG